MKRLTLLAVIAALLLTGCNNSLENSSENSLENSSESMVQSESSDISSETSEDTSSSSSETSDIQQTEEKSFMELSRGIIVDMQPPEIEETREGVQYSEFKNYTYYSRTAERDTGVNVLLPPNYSEDKEYPVMYILHGYYDNASWMTRPVVSIPAMLGNLIADGEAEEMIIVSPYIYCSKDMPYCTGMDLQNSLNYDNFINDLLTDLMPFIESNFSVAKGRENTAITGFSMGGRESLFIGFTRPDLFGYIGGVCPAPGLAPLNPNSSTHPGQMDNSDLVFKENAPYALLVSAAVNDGVVGRTPYTYRDTLEWNGTEFIFHEISQGGHDHTSVKPHLYNFFRLAFKAK